MSCATVETPTEAEMDAALVFTTDGYSDADGVDHVTAPAAVQAALSAERTAEAAIREVLVEPATLSPAITAAKAAAALPYSARETGVFAAQMDKLTAISLCCRSEALRRAIRAAMAIKRREFDLRRADARAEHVSGAVSEASATAAEEAAVERVEAEVRASWHKAEEELDQAASVVLAAPVDGDHDLLARADAFLLLVGDEASPCATKADPDRAVTALLSIRGEVEDRINRRPDREAFDAAEITYRKHERELCDALREEERLKGLIERGGEVEDRVMQGLKARIDNLYGQRDDVRDMLLSEAPADASGLLTVIDVVMDCAFVIAVDSYAARQRWADRGEVTCASIRDEPDGADRAMALVARHVARLRDLELPIDWARLMGNDAGVVSLHPNTADALRLAYDKGLAPSDLSGIQLQGRPEEDLPTLTFSDGGEGFVTVSPSEALKWGKVQ